MDYLWKFVSIIGPIAIIFLSAVMVRQRRKIKADPDTETSELLSLQKLLETALFAIVTELERTFDSGTGQLKLAAAVERVTALVPEKWRRYFDTEKIVELVERTLKQARVKWTENSALVGKSDQST